MSEYSISLSKSIKKASSSLRDFSQDRFYGKHTGTQIQDSPKRDFEK